MAEERLARPLPLLALGALGVVFGDIGTSPLYAIRESFEGTGHEIAVTDERVLGILSLVFWSLIVVVSLKYVIFVLRADHDGEGGVLALMSLTDPEKPGRGRRGWVLLLIGLFGTALLYGDGMITPAISVLSAVEGTEVATSSFEHLVIPLAVVILVGIFAVQRRGTASIGAVFGPVMVLWFGVLGVLGLAQIAQEPSVLRALAPDYAVRFFADNGFTGFLVLGSVFLVVTGGEALYADMGHFGRRPIRVAWFALVLPALLLNYFGQGALLIDDPSAIDNPFYRLAPSWALIPLVVLATAATVIASQALISGASSLTMQAVQLGYSPRVQILHTSPTEIGQIYVPAINWALMTACIALVIGFRTSTNLAAAYGVAVTATMAITTVLFYVVTRRRFGWSRLAAGSLCAVFLLVDVAFLGANLFKIPAGGWFPLVIGGLVFALLTTWRKGRMLVGERIMRGRLPLTDLVASVQKSAPQRTPGASAYLFSTPGYAPPALLANLRHYGVLTELVLVVSIVTDDLPRVHPVRRLDVTPLGAGFQQLVVHVGFMEAPHVHRVLSERGVPKLGFAPEALTYFLGREALRVTDREGMVAWREHLFAAMARNATPAANYFGIPPDQTIEVGIQVEL